MADFSPDAAFERLKESTTEVVKSYFPVEGQKNILRVSKAWIDDDKHIDDIRSQKEARVQNRTWSVPIRAQLELVDKHSGKVIDKKEVTLAQLPKITRRHSFIVDGNEWQVGNQFRLKSGVYTRIKENGDLESQWNLKKGRGFRMGFDPETKKLNLRYDTASVPLYPVLKLLGVDDDAIEKRWGRDMLQANMKAPEDRALRQLYKSLVDDKVPASLEEVKSKVLERLHKTELRPDSTAITLGKPFDKVDGDALLHGAEKILKVSRKEVEPDDRDGLQFKDFFSVEDLLKERLDKDARRDIAKKFFNKIDRHDKISDMVHPDIFGRPIKSFFTNSAITERPMQTNPMNFLLGARKTTIGGEHGLNDPDKITTEAKQIHPSHLGFLDAVTSPESERIGTVLQMASGAKKIGKEIFTSAYNTKTKKLEWVSPAKALASNVAFPDQYQWEGDHPKPMHDDIKIIDGQGQMSIVKPNKVDYVLRSSKGLFDLAANMIPFLQNDQGNRTMVASKQLEQAVSLVHREAPLVQSKGVGHGTFERAVGRFNSHESPVEGTIEHVAADHILVKDSSGQKHEVQLYDHFPLNDNKAFLHSTPLVKKGDSVKAGQLIADTNFSKNGELALGVNLKTAYLPYRGLNYDDGVVISESAAKKLTSAHLHQESITADDNIILNKNKFLAETAGQISRAQIDKLDDHGVIKVGTIVQPGDVLIGALKKEEHTQEQKQLGVFSKRTLSPVAVRAKTWDRTAPGVVTQVVRQGKETTVYVRAESPMEVGDKLTARHGNKGVVSAILPDHEMPRTKDGVHAEILINPATLPSRINLGQALETAASKIARKTGKTYVVDNFDGKTKDYTKDLQEELKKHGISDKEVLHDPVTGKELGDALFGDQYILKLHHMAEAGKGLFARSRGAYDINMAPKQGGQHGGQTMDAFGLYALLAHGARENIREMQTTKSNMDDDYWTALQAGESVPPPKVPFAFKKFEGYLKAIGINTVKDGNGMHLVPHTDKQLLALSQGELKHPDKLIRAKDLKPEVGGLFDPKITGTEFPHGKLGDRWAHFTLGERMPNPVFERPIATLIGTKAKDIENIVSGKQALHGKTGPEAIVHALEKIDVVGTRKKLEEGLGTMRKGELSDAVQKIKYLRALERFNLKPHEAYTMQHLPVLPPVMRPLSVMDNGELNEADQNGLYKNIAETNQQLKTFDPSLPVEEKHELHEELYDGMKALMLTGSTNRGRHRRGIMDIISRGKSEGPKGGYFQDKVIGRRQDLSMRGVIIPDPSLGLDEFAIPRKAAAEILKPFLVQRLVRNGLSPLQAQQEVKKSSASAQAALEAEVKERPLLLKRDPVLHKYGVQAFKPILTQGNSIRIHPLVTMGLGADFDGDKVSVYAPVSAKAVKEAYNMLPSRNLFNPSDGKLMFAPTQEAQLGLYKLSLLGKETKHTFKNASDAALAAKSGKIGINDVIHIEDPHTFVKEASVRTPVKTTVGRLLLHHALPEEAREDRMLTDPHFELTKKNLSGLLTNIAKKYGGDTFGRAADALKDLGNAHVTGSSFGLDDLRAHTAAREEIFAPAREQEQKIRASALPKEVQDEKIIKLYTEASEKVQKKVRPMVEASRNRMYDWVRSGAKGNWDQFRQMIIAPVLVADSKGKTIPAPITKSYSEGLDTASYWASLYGARMGTIGRVEGTRIPGTQSKEMLQSTMNQLVVEDDCKTQKGITFDVDDRGALDRFTASDIHLGERGGKQKGLIPAGTLVTPDVLARLKNNRIKSVPVRTPLKCQTSEGLCSKCYGLSQDGHTHPKGTNVGVMAVHALGEPLVQIAMRVFHEGGTAGSKGAQAIDRISRLKQLIELPKTLPFSATLANSGGKVKHVEKDAATGGWHVDVAGERHFVPSRLEVTVKPGDEVKRGDALSTGPVNPRELLPLKNLSAVQTYLTDELQKIYENPSNIHRRNTEVFVRALTNLSVITDPGDHPEWMHGDSVTTSQIQAYNAKLPQGKGPVHYMPVLKGANMLPLEAQTDWLARLQHRELSRTIQDAAAEGWVSNLHGTHPVPAMAVGTEFGHGTKDAPWLY